MEKLDSRMTSFVLELTLVRLLTNFKSGSFGEPKVIDRKCVNVFSILLLVICLKNLILAKSCAKKTAETKNLFSSLKKISKSICGFDAQHSSASVGSNFQRTIFSNPVKK